MRRSLLAQTSSSPLLLPALCFAIGTGIATHCSFPPRILLLVFLACATLFALRLWLRSGRTMARVSLAVLFLVAGTTHARLSTIPISAAHIKNIISQKQEATLTGTLTRKPIRKNRKTRLILDVDSVLLPDASESIPAIGLVQLTVNTQEHEAYEIGKRYMAKARLDRPRNFGTPGSFDYQGFLAEQKIFITGWVRTPQLIMPLKTNTTATALSPYTLEKIRLTIEFFLHKTLAPQTSGMYQALLLGDRSGLASHVLEIYKKAGAMHLLAISGMHLGIVAFLISTALVWIFSRSEHLLLNRWTRHISILLALTFLTIYAGLAGFQIPVIRALIMVAIFMLALIADKQWISINNLAAAALIILVWKPASIASASFQLSFAATLAIILVLPLCSAWLHGTQRTAFTKTVLLWLLSCLVISLVAFVATAPLSVLHFNRLSLLSSITTLLVTPFLCFWALPLGLSALLFVYPAPKFAAFLLEIGSWGLTASERIASTISSVPFASIRLGTPTSAEVVALYLLLSSLLLWPNGKRWRCASLVPLALLLCLFFGPRIFSHQTDKSHIHYLDVGQGSATVIKTPGDKTILIDGGGPFSDRFNVGEQVIAPFLWQHKIKTVDLLVITHAHADHYNGLPFLISHFQPKTIWISEPETSDKEFNKLAALAREMGCTVKIGKGGLVHREGDWTITCLANLGREAFGANHLDNPNNRGMVVRFRHGNNSFLFPGDIETDAENRLFAENDKLSAQVLLMPHHGYASSGSARFMNAVQPDIVIVSAKGTLMHDELAGQTPARDIYQTSMHGTITATTDGKKISVSTYYGPDGYERLGKE